MTEYEYNPCPYGYNNPLCCGNYEDVYDEKSGEVIQNCMEKIFITTILGDTKEVTESFEDGSYTCPFCNYPTKENCNNPACEASPHWTVETLTQYLEKCENIRLEKENRERFLNLRNSSYGRK
jgi:hypothetical protein